jgi:sodium-dependent phosphate transporter
MAGPLGTIVEVVNTGQLNKNVNPILWCVALGAVGLVIGLATYGYNIVRVVGVKLAKLSPTRGFCAEISTAFVILIAAQYGLPTSSSQVITGGIIGVGLCEVRAGEGLVIALRTTSRRHSRGGPRPLR